MKRDNHQNSNELLTNVYNRPSISLDGKWNAIVDPYKNGYYNYRRQPHDETPNPGAKAYFIEAKTTDEADRVEYDFRASPSLQVPGSWNTQIEEYKWYEGAMWYQRDLSIQKKADKRYYLYFGAANYDTQVWVNGKNIGSHIGGFTPFNFDATEFLRDGSNSVIVLVDDSRHPEAIPTVNTDWWNHGGITRSVSLIELPKVFIRDFHLQLSQDGKRLVGAVELSEPTTQEVTLNIPELDYDWHGKTDSYGRASIDLPAPKLQRWDVNDPKLYDIEIGSADDQMTDKVGFRTVEVRGQEILLNGKKIFLRGISMHEECPLDGGRNHSLEHARMMFQWAKELNANFARLAHYPHNEHMPRLADELGFLLWEEVPVYWTIDWENKDTLANAKNQLTEVIKRDRNRASVIIWSVANETPVSDVRNAFLGELVKTARELDSTRLVSAAMELANYDKDKLLDDPFGEQTDIISFNQYHGWYYGTPDEFPELTWDIKYEKPVIISEFGADALYGKRGSKNAVWTEDHQAFVYEKTIEGLANIPGLAGITPWILADFRSPRRPLPKIQDMWNRKGLVSEGGRKKLAFHVLRKFFEEKQKQEAKQLEPASKEVVSV